MSSRNSLASKGKGDDTKPSAGAALSDRTILARDEMPINPNEKVNETPALQPDCRSDMRMKLHSVLRTLMTARSESARSAAKACGIPLSTFSGYLKPGKRQVDPKHLMAIAAHYGVTIDHLFGQPETVKLDRLPTKTLFSKWVKLTIEDMVDGDEITNLLGKVTEK